MVVLHTEQRAALKGALAVDGLPQCINHPPLQEGAHAQAEPPPGVAHKISRRDTAHV